MTITFHCKFCNKKIEAKDSSSGKWGMCPGCHNKIYVPADIVHEEDDELRLAPVDEEDKRRQEQLMEETYQLSQQILNEREAAEEDEPAKEKERVVEMNEQQLAAGIKSYLRNMADGRLEQAQQIAAQIRPLRQKALPIIDRIALSDIPERGLENIPPQVLAGLIRTLRSQLS